MIFILEMYLILVGIERLFARVFKTNVQIDGFYSLIKEASSSSGEVK